MTDTADKITQAGWRERLGDGEFFVNGDTFDLVFRPGGGSFASNDIVVGKMACGDTAFYLPQEIARLLNASTRPPISSPVAGELASELRDLKFSPSTFSCKLHAPISLDLVNRILTALQAQPAVDDGPMRDVLAKAANTFRFYQRSHSEKARQAEENDEANARHDKAERNREMAELCEAALATHQGQSAAALDTERLNWLQSEYRDVRWISSEPDEVGVRIVSHHMAKPQERVEAENWFEDLRAAIDEARGPKETEG